MQVGGLDALENAAVPDCPPASTADLAKDPIDELREDTVRSLQLANTCIHQHMQFCYIFDTSRNKSDSFCVRYGPATGNPEAITPHVPGGCVDLHNAVIGDTCKPDCASKFIIAAVETPPSMRYSMLMRRE
jgi:hypothetical protein